MGIVGSGGGARGLGATQEQRERVDVKVEAVSVEAAQVQMSIYSTRSTISINILGLNGGQKNVPDTTVV